MPIAATWAPTPVLQETAYAYLGFQLVMSYFILGWIELKKPDWRSAVRYGIVSFEIVAPLGLAWLLVK